MVREVKPLTSVVPVDPRTSQRRGKLIDEIYDPEANADAGEQLSLETECPHPDCHQPIAKTTKKRTGTRNPAQSKTDAKANSKTSPKSTRTVSKAKRKNTSVSFTINDVSDPNVSDHLADDLADSQLANTQLAEANTDNQSLNDLQQQIAELQSRLSGLQNTASPRLPNWSEPELRSDTTLQQAQQAYQALESGTAHRYPRPRNPSTSGVSSFAESRSMATRLAEARRLQSQQTPQRAQRRRKSRLNWNAERFGQNILRLVERVVPMPIQPTAKVVDAIAWIISAIGLRLLLKIVMLLIPALAWPINLVMALPALIAIYLAFCVENSRSDVIYRLLLVTVGIFIASRL